MAKQSVIIMLAIMIAGTAYSGHNHGIGQGRCQGDINGDNAITPFDALCAFEKYMGICPTSGGFDCGQICGDANDDGACTPADALCIFNAYLGKPNCLDITAGDDIVPPVITILGENPTHVCPFYAYADSGAVALDDRDGVVPVMADDNINTDVGGRYAVWYTAEDQAGNLATGMRTVNVMITCDFYPPVITLIGENPATVCLGSDYADSGATAEHARDGQVPVEMTHDINTDAIGTYTVTYLAMDKAANLSTATRTVNVIDCSEDITAGGGNP